MAELKKGGFRRLCGITALGIGVVYGDIGTSPLYALKECFHVHGGLQPNPYSILGVLSLIFWSLFLIVSGKYITFVMRADYNGEGGILALISLLTHSTKRAVSSKWTAFFVTIGIFGAALLYGDGMITPAISVLSAIEGLAFATPELSPLVIPITILILILLFSFQKVGTGRVGGVFGPIMIVWFLTLAALGISHIIRNPGVLIALNPAFGIRFLTQNGFQGLYVLGSVFLAVTGAEALYADLGHFGATPIRLGWFALVLPSLVLNYFGQGALLLNNPALIENPFYGMAPSWGVFPLVALATAATVIASQALITGAFSLTLQAIQLGYLPRLHVQHTSAETSGQIYIPQINWILMLACIALVAGFKSSSALASAYGIAVTLTMILTTILFAAVMRNVWQWSLPAVAGLTGIFLFAELGFFAANSLKIPQGGWFALVSAVIIFFIMGTWKKGRALLFERLRPGLLPLDIFIDDVETTRPVRVDGCAVFLSSTKGITPLALLHNVRHNKVLHKNIIILTVLMDSRPVVPEEEGFGSTSLRSGFHQVTATYGYMQEPDVPSLIQELAKINDKIEINKVTYFLSRETLIKGKPALLHRWQRSLFIFLSRNATSPAQFFNLPPGRVIELGVQIEM